MMQGGCTHVAPIPEAASTSRDLKTLRAMMFSIYPLDEPTSVDCTLSLGTPSTRLAGGEHCPRASLPPWSSSSCMSIHNSLKGKPGRSTSSATEALVERRCANCDSTSTPLWRKGPRGPRSLCNACGIRFKKEERKMSTLSLKQGFPATSVGHEHISGQKESVVVSVGLPFLSFRVNVSDNNNSGIVSFFKSSANEKPTAQVLLV